MTLWHGQSFDIPHAVCNQWGDPGESLKGRDMLSPKGQFEKLY